MPQALGKYILIKDYVDDNHAGNMANMILHSGIIIYVNNAPIIWYSKLQNTVEASIFGSQSVDPRIYTEIIEELRYKLRCLGIPVEGPTEVFCDNTSVVKNSVIPTSDLNKRYNVIFYYRVTEDRLQVFSSLGGFHESLIQQTFLQRQQCLGIQGIIWLIQSSLTQHHQLMVLIRHRFICTWVHLSTSHTTRVIAEIGFWYSIFYSNQSSMVINLQGLDKYGSKQTGSRTNAQAKIGGTCEQKRSEERASEQERMGNI